MSIGIEKPGYEFPEPVGLLHRPPFWYQAQRVRYSDGDKVWYWTRAGWHAGVVQASHATVDIFIISFLLIPAWSVSEVALSCKHSGNSYLVWPRTHDLAPDPLTKP